MAPDARPDALARLGREAAALEGPIAASAAWRALVAEADDLRGLAEGEGDGGAPAGGAGAPAAGAAGGAAPGERAELARMARAELAALAPALETAQARLVASLLPRDEADGRSAIVEVRAGVGGEEAALFAGELAAMYAAYAGARGWAWAVLSEQREESAGGLREGSYSVAAPDAGGGARAGAAGGGVFGRLRHESGVHRVQRVPVTQSTGKLQTSTATVTVLPEAEDVDVHIAPGDVRVETFRSRGAGGQSVNTTDSAVRVTHVPTGVVVAIQDERSQIQNRAKALKVLRARLWEAERERVAAARSRDRKSQIGTSARSDRVRTYNYAQNRVTDHRVGLSKHDIGRFLAGDDLDELFDALDRARQEEALAALDGDGAGGGAR